MEVIDDKNLDWSGPERLINPSVLNPMLKPLVKELKKVNLENPGLEVVSKAYCDGHDTYNVLVKIPIPGTDSSLAMMVTITIDELQDRERMRKGAQRVRDMVVQQLRLMAEEEKKAKLRQSGIRHIDPVEHIQAKVHVKKKDIN